jgi:hypothetical protein
MLDCVGGDGRRVSATLGPHSSVPVLVGLVMILVDYWQCSSDFRLCICEFTIGVCHAYNIEVHHF